MIISKEEFQRLISAYIDGEISAVEAQNLFDCIRSNKDAKTYFLRSCAMHKNLSKLYGRKIKFQRIAGLDVEKLIESPKHAHSRMVSEWSIVACLFVACTILMCVAMNSSQAENSEDSDIESFSPQNYQTKIHNHIKTDNNEASIIEISPKHLIIKND